MSRRSIYLAIIALVASLAFALAGNAHVTRAAGGSISGIVYFDSNLDGFREPDDAPAPGYQVEVRNEAGELVDTSVSDTNGRYSVQGLVADTNYTIALVPDDTTLCSQEPMGVPGGEQMGGPDFWVVKKGSGTISGTLFNDVDEDGVRDAEEPALTGWSTTLSAGSCYIRATTAVDGSYQVRSLPNAAYSLYAVPSSLQDLGPWEQTTQTERMPGNSAVAGLSMPAPVDLVTKNDLRNVDVGMHLVKGTGRISGQYFRDYDLDGLKDETEPVIECLWGYFFGIARKLPSGDSLYLDFTPTCQDGHFEVSGLPAGEYNLSFKAWCYDLHPQQPSTPWVTLAEGEHATGANIGLCPEIQGPTPEPDDESSPVAPTPSVAQPPSTATPSAQPAVNPPDTGDGTSSGRSDRLLDVLTAAIAVLGFSALAFAARRRVDGRKSP